MCIKKYIEGIIGNYLNSHPHPVEDHTHENYIDKEDIGYAFFANSDKINWVTSASSNSTTIYLNIK